VLRTRPRPSSPPSSHLSNEGWIFPNYPPQTLESHSFEDRLLAELTNTCGRWRCMYMKDSMPSQFRSDIGFVIVETNFGDYRVMDGELECLKLHHHPGESSQPRYSQHPPCEAQQATYTQGTQHSANCLLAPIGPGLGLKRLQRSSPLVESQRQRPTQGCK
jgi:hypothetical protein